jgi:hypothetical protein
MGHVFLLHYNVDDLLADCLGNVRARNLTTLQEWFFYKHVSAYRIRVPYLFLHSGCYVRFRKLGPGRETRTF